MKRKILSQVRVLLNIQLNHLILVAAAVSVLGLFDMPDSFLFLWVLLGIVPVGMYYFRVKIKKISIFFVCIGTFLALGFMFQLKIEAKLLLVGMLILYSFFTIKKKLSENPEIVELVSPAVFVVVIGAMTIKNHAYRSQCYGIAWVYFLMYFLYHFLTSYLRFVDINENSASNMPEKELFTHGIKQVGIFTVIAMFFSFLSSNTDWVAKIINAIGEWVRMLLKDFLASITEPIIEESVPKQPVVDTMQEEMLGAIEYSEWVLYLHKILEIMYNLITIVLLMVVFVCAVRGIIKFVKENFTKVGKRKEAKTILSNQDIRESCQVEVAEKEKRSILGFLSNEQRIRKAYKKKVLREKARIIGESRTEGLAYLTAKECCEKMEDLELKNVYEKVRYSAEKVTGEDVRRAKG